VTVGAPAALGEPGRQRHPLAGQVRQWLRAAAQVDPNAAAGPVRVPRGDRVAGTAGLGALGAFYRTGHPDSGAESGAAPAPPPEPRPPDGHARALTAAQLAEARRLRARGWTQARLAGRYGVSPSTVNRALRGITGRRPGQSGQPG
jgi:hypothetical protein